MPGPGQNGGTANLVTLPLLILAAGLSQRFGVVDKRRVTLPKGGEMLAAMIRRGGKAGLSVRPVLRRGDPLAAQLAATPLLVDNAEEGMGATLASAVAQLLADDPEQRCTALLVMPADLPLIRIRSLRAVAENAASDRIIVPVCQGRRGHPVAFGRQYWPDLATLSGDQGARGLIQTLGEAALRRLELRDPGIYRDVDTPEALSEVIQDLDPPLP